MWNSNCFYNFCSSNKCLKLSTPLSPQEPENEVAHFNVKLCKSQSRQAPLFKSVSKLSNNQMTQLWCCAMGRKAWILFDDAFSNDGMCAFTADLYTGDFCKCDWTQDLLYRSGSSTSLVQDHSGL